MTADTEGKLTEDINAPPVGTVRPVGLNAARLAGRQDEPEACPRELVTAAWSIPSFVHTWFRVCSCAGWRLLW